MALVETSASAKIRSELSHPVLDCDGHWQEPTPVLLEYIRKIGGSSAADSYLKVQNEAWGNNWYGLSVDDRTSHRKTRPTWWGAPGNTLDRATSMLPALLYRRLDDFGVDYAIILATRNSPGAMIADPQLRRVVVRATNVMHSEMFAPYADRMTGAATIPTNTPEEGIEEAEYAVKELGLKVGIISGSLRRPVAASVDNKDADPRAGVPYYIDSLALDSPYDYDPLWAKFVELKLAPMTHSGSIGWVDRSSPTNFVFNHVGHFAQGSHSFARALFLGGVVRRFPTLKFGFLEGGIGWARILCADLVGHWEKRNKRAVLADLNPANLDLAQLRELINEYGGDWAARGDELMGDLDGIFPGIGVEELINREINGPNSLDDFEPAGLSSKKEVATEFAKNFFFGCESDDPMTALAFDSRLGPRLRPLFSSDVSHFDVTDMTEVLEEAYELVEHGLIDENEFREFTFSNTVALHAGTNPDFFKGTVVEKQAEEELARQAAVAAKEQGAGAAS